MALLIRNGLLHTMTAQGSFRGDVLIAGGRILRVEEHIDDTADITPHVVQADGLTILPGLIDMSVRDGGLADSYLTEIAVLSGVTTMLKMPDEGECCRLLQSDREVESDLRLLHPDTLTDDQLGQRLEEHKRDGLQSVCDIHGRDQGTRVLQIARQAASSPIMLELTGCEGMEQAIAEAGCPAIIGVHHDRCGSPWLMAARLHALGVPVAISCNHPAAKLKLLPVCASLCVRDGMPREQALRTITCTPASMLGLKDCCGCIAPGFRADLAVYDGDPLLLATDHVMTIAKGKIYKR